MVSETPKTPRKPQAQNPKKTLNPNQARRKKEFNKNQNPKKTLNPKPKLDRSEGCWFLYYLHVFHCKEHQTGAVRILTGDKFRFCFTTGTF